MVPIMFHRVSTLHKRRCSAIATAHARDPAPASIALFAPCVSMEPTPRLSPQRVFHDQEDGWQYGSFAARAKSPKPERAWSLVNLIWGVLTEAQVLSCELIDGCASHKLHIARDFAPHQIQRAFDTRLPRGREWE